MTSRMRRSLLGLGVAVLLVVGATIAVGRERRADSASGSLMEASGPKERVRVQVLNAGGVTGLAREATGHLRDAGFDVVEYGDASSWDRDSTWVVDRVGRPDVAHAVAVALGIDKVRSELDPDLFVDVTVLLGREWTPDGPAGEPEESSGDLPWWNPRSWRSP